MAWWMRFRISIMIDIIMCVYMYVRLWKFTYDDIWALKIMLLRCA